MKLYYNNDICPKCGNLTDHRNSKVCSECYRAYKKEYYKANKEELKAYIKEYQKANKEAIREQHKLYYKEYYNTNKEVINAYKKDYNKAQLNSNSDTLHNIRTKSSNYLFKVLNHTKLDNYEIHHCFSYNDYTKFIYIPKSLHLKIHQYLRDNNIDAKSNHYNEIVQMINECNEYTYIHI